MDFYRDKYYMEKAIQLGKKGLGFVSPNPAVGAVIIKNNCIVGQGYHSKAGEEHAEIEALKKAGKEAKGAALYVTLEPCSHFGKTPPCTEQIIKAGIKKVVYACPDQNPKVKGKEVLEKRGIEVKGGFLAHKAEFLSLFHQHFMLNQKPYITLKYAMSWNGKITGSKGKPLPITTKPALNYSHFMRHCYDAILVGKNTVKIDNPQLTIRYLPGRFTSQPIRIVLDTNGTLDYKAKIFQASGRAILATAMDFSVEKEKMWKEMGVEILKCKKNSEERIDLSDLVFKLGERGITSLLVEGGSQTLSSFIGEKIAQEIMIFLGPKMLGGENMLGPLTTKYFKNQENIFRIKSPLCQQMGDNFILRGKIQY